MDPNSPWPLLIQFLGYRVSDFVRVFVYLAAVFLAIRLFLVPVIHDLLQ